MQLQTNENSTQVTNMHMYILYCHVHVVLLHVHVHKGTNVQCVTNSLLHMYMCVVNVRVYTF